MNPFGNMSDRELELLVRFIAKASPPPILYRYRRASEWAIKELQAPEVHIASIDDMNDPFEYRAPLSIDIEKLRVSMFAYAREQLGMDHDAAQEEAEFVNQFGVTYLQESIEALRSASGLICCSSNPRSNRMWAYYGDSQKGICVGYSTDFSPFCFSRRVDYADPVSSIDLLDTLKQEPTLSIRTKFLAGRVRSGTSNRSSACQSVPLAQGKTRLLPVRPKPLWRSVLGQKSAWIQTGGR